MNFCAIPAPAVVDIWPQVSPGLDDLLDNHSMGKWNHQEVLQNLINGDWTLFVVSDEDRIIASLVCSIMEGHKKTLEVGLCWGTDAAEWTGEVSDAFEQIAKEMGCEQIALDGRPGWRSIARKLGYKMKSVIYTRQVHG